MIAQLMFFCLTSKYKQSDESSFSSLEANRLIFFAADRKVELWAPISAAFDVKGSVPIILTFLEQGYVLFYTCKKRVWGEFN